MVLLLAEPRSYHRRLQIFCEKMAPLAAVSSSFYFIITMYSRCLNIIAVVSVSNKNGFCLVMSVCLSVCFPVHLSVCLSD